MKFPNAAKGVKKIFNAEIIALIAALGTGIGLIMSLIGSSKEAAQANAESLLVTAGAILIISGIIVLIAGIMNIIGFLQAAKDEIGIKRAVLCTVFGSVFSVVASVFAGRTGFLGGLGTVFSATSHVLNMLVAIYLVNGLMNLSEKCNRTDMVKFGHEILTTIIVSYIISFVLSLLVNFGAITTSLGFGLIKWLSGLTILFAVFIYFLELIYLGRAKKMLAEN